MASSTLLEQYGISSHHIDNREAVVPLDDYVRFFEAAAAAADNPVFGLHSARLMSADGLGALSFLFLSAPTLAQAFATFTEYLDTMQEATFNAFAEESDTFHFSYAIRDSAISPRRQDAEYSIGVMCNLVRQYLGRNNQPHEVHFEHQKQGALNTYENYFGCPVYFEQPHNRLYLPKDLLDCGSSALSPELFPIIAGHLRLRMHGSEGTQSLKEQVQTILLTSSPDELPLLDETAILLGLSRTTLMRRLKRENTRFGELVDARRIGFAQQLMVASKRSIADIALASGYSETASFTRAFVRRIGTTPSLWRKTRKSPFGMTSRGLSIG